MSTETGRIKLVHAGQQGGSKQSLRAWLQMLKCAKRVEQEMAARFRVNHGSSMSRFDVLAHLYEADGTGLSTTQLANKLLASRGNITRLLDRMEEDGLIERRPNRHDRRISDIHLADAGRRMFARMAPAHEGWSDELFSVLREDEKEELIALVQRIRHRLEQDSDT